MYLSVTPKALAYALQLYERLKDTFSLRYWIEVTLVALLEDTEVDCFCSVP